MRDEDDGEKKRRGEVLETRVHAYAHARRRPEAREVRAGETESKIISGSTEINRANVEMEERTRTKRASPRLTDVSLEA